MPTNVTLFLKGSLVLFAKEGQPAGSVRILREPPPNHTLTINFREQPPGGTFGDPIAVSPVQDALRLEVQNTAHPNITLRDRDAVIDRKTRTHLGSARWFVDLENRELYDRPIGVDPVGFKQVLTFNSGELFNDVSQGDSPSTSPLLIQKGINANYEEFGFVAVRIGIAFTGAQRVVFTNGGGLVFDSAQKPDGTNFEISLDHDARAHPQPIITDANHYYKAVGSGIPHDKRTFFASVKAKVNLLIRLDEAKSRRDSALVAELEALLAGPGVPAGPEAACFPAYLGRSEL